MVKALYFLAIMLTAIALGAGLAHLFELPNKIGLDGQDYFTVQRNVGLVVPLAFLSVLAITFALRGTGTPFSLALIALLLLVGELVVFWGFHRASHRATENWTMLPSNWEELRTQWEYSHAARTFLARDGLSYELLQGVRGLSR